MFINGFLLCSKLLVCDVYTDETKYETYEDCQKGGTPLYEKLVKSASDDDFVVGDCVFTLPQTPIDKDGLKAYLSRRYLGHLKDSI